MTTECIHIHKIVCAHICIVLQIGVLWIVKATVRTAKVTTTTTTEK